MAHAAVEEHPPLHMGLPLSNGKLAMWLFLITEIMFFTGLIGTYSILRNGQPAPARHASAADQAAAQHPAAQDAHGRKSWPTPHQVHLVEWIGALNTFVLICSSLTVVLAHFAIARGNVRGAVGYIGITLALGVVFLAVK